MEEKTSGAEIGCKGQQPSDNEVNVLVWGDATRIQAWIETTPGSTPYLDWSIQPKGAGYEYLGGAPYISDCLKSILSQLDLKCAVKIWLSKPKGKTVPLVFATWTTHSKFSAHFEIEPNERERYANTDFASLKFSIGASPIQGQRDDPSRSYLERDEWKCYVLPLESKTGISFQWKKLKGSERPVMTTTCKCGSRTSWLDIDVLVIAFEGHALAQIDQPEWLEQLPQDTKIIIKYHPGDTISPHWPLWLYYWLVDRSSNVFCVTDANALREDDLTISRGRSWERTLQDVMTSKARRGKHHYRRMSRVCLINFENHGLAVRRRPRRDEGDFFGDGAPFAPNFFSLSVLYTQLRARAFAEKCNDAASKMVELQRKFENDVSKCALVEIAETWRKSLQSCENLLNKLSASLDKLPAEGKDFIAGYKSLCLSHVLDQTKFSLSDNKQDQESVRDMIGKMLSEFDNESSKLPAELVAEKQVISECLQWTAKDEREAFQTLEATVPEGLLKRLDRNRSTRWSLIFEGNQSDEVSIEEREHGLAPGGMGVITAAMAAYVVQAISNSRANVVGAGESETKGKADNDHIFREENYLPWAYLGMVCAALSAKFGYLVQPKNTAMKPQFCPLFANSDVVRIVWKNRQLGEIPSKVGKFCSERFDAGYYADGSSEVLSDKPQPVHLGPSGYSQESELFKFLQGREFGDVRPGFFHPDKQLIDVLHTKAREYEDYDAAKKAVTRAVSRYEYHQWSIAKYALGRNIDKAYELAHRILTNGICGDTLRRMLPHFSAKDKNGREFITIDRREIESCRDIEARLVEFRNRCWKARERLQSGPILNLLCFGAPGSGKSFSTNLLAKKVMGELLSNELVINLTQTHDVNQHIEQLQEINNIIAKGKIPFVIFDEFDTTKGGVPFYWLPFFLSPMEDGSYLSRFKKAEFGAAIFLFIGSRFSSAEQFGRACRDELVDSDKVPTDTLDSLKQQKGRDFESRIDGRISVPSLNPHSDDTDFTYLIQRALLMRGILLNDYPMLQKNVDGELVLDISEHVARAFLRVSNYYHNLRSMKKIIQASSISSKRRFERSDLPSFSQLSPHVDAGEFLSWTRHDGARRPHTND